MFPSPCQSTAVTRSRPEEITPVSCSLVSVGTGRQTRDGKMAGKGPGRPPPCSPHPPQLPRLSPRDARRAVPVPLGNRAETRDRNTQRGEKAKDGKAFAPQRSPAARLPLPAATSSPRAPRRLPGRGGGWRLRPFPSGRGQVATELPLYFMFSSPVHEHRLQRIIQN